MPKTIVEMFGPFPIIMQILEVLLLLAPDAHLAAKVPQVEVLVGVRIPPIN